MSTSNHIQMTLIDTNQASPEVTANTALVKLETSLYKELAVAMGDANQTLTDDQYNSNGLFTCTGALTAQKNLVVPTREKLFFVQNSTTGGFGVQAKTSAGTGVVVASGAAAICYTDGTNVISLGGASVSGAVSSVFGRTGAVVATSGDYDASEITGLATVATSGDYDDLINTPTIANYSDIPLAYSGGPPTSNEVIGGIIVARTTNFAANFSGSAGYIRTNPTTSFVISVQDDGSEIGTITVSTLGAFTFATSSGTSKVVAAGSRLEFVAPASADATAAYILATLAGTN
jgi:hypothetical protein